MEKPPIPQIALREIQTLVANELEYFATCARTSTSDIYVARRRKYAAEMMPHITDSKVTRARKLVFSAKVWITQEVIQHPKRYSGYCLLVQDVQVCAEHFFQALSTEARAIGNSIAHTVYSTVQEYYAALDDTANESERNILYMGLVAVNDYQDIPSRWGVHRMRLDNTLDSVVKRRVKTYSWQRDSRFDKEVAGDVGL